MDFLGKSVTNNLIELKEIVKEICSIQYEDAVNFETETVEANVITEGKDNAGARVKIIAKLGNARIAIWLDIGFGDNIVAGPVEVDFPILLDFEAPKINVYSLESAIAEKFQACVKLNFDNSRMKDFYNINELAANNSFNLQNLAEAVTETFKTRQTDVAKRNIIFADDFKKDEKKEIQWQAFLKRTSLNSDFSFYEIVDRIEKFITEACNLKSEKREWDNSSWVWK